MGALKLAKKAKILGVHSGWKGILKDFSKLDAYGLESSFMYN